MKTTATTATKLAATAAALIVMGLGLTACGGSSADGEYIAAHGDDSLIVATLDGDTLNVSMQYCNDGEINTNQSNPGTGTLNEEQTNVLWAESARGNDTHDATDGGYDSENRSPVTIDGGTLTIGNVTYSASDSSQGKQIRDSATTACAG